MMTVLTAYFVPMIAAHTYRVEIWTGAEDIKEIITLDHDYDALEVLGDMLTKKHPELRALTTTFALWSQEELEYSRNEIPEWNTRSITAQVAIG
jgi:hypothetical protein